MSNVCIFARKRRRRRRINSHESSPILSCKKWSGLVKPQFAGSCNRFTLYVVMFSFFEYKKKHNKHN